jgi:hypothetical protein
VHSLEHHLPNQAKPKEVREQSERLQLEENVNEEKLTSGSMGGAAGEGGARRGRRAAAEEAPMRCRRAQRQPHGRAARVRPRRVTEVDGRRQPGRAIGGSATRHGMSA